MKAVSFLLGAGVSMPFGTPSGWELTKELLEPSPFWYMDGSIFRKSTSLPIDPSITHPSWPIIESIAAFAKILIDETKEYFDFRNREASYEDIFGLCFALQDYESDKYVTEPLIGASYRNIKSKCLNDKVIDSKKSEIASVSSLCKSTMMFIKSILNINLNVKNFCHNDLDTLIDFVKSSYNNKVNIFTLNHDLIVEKLLQKANIVYADGFDSNDYFIEDFYLWNPDVYNANNNVNLLKLHGSIDWENFLLDINEILYTTCRGKDGLNVRGLKTRDNRLLSHSDTPEYLTGAMNKFVYYNYDKFLDTQFYFKRLLNESNILVISGYSFGDTGINRRIIEWLYKGQHKYIIVIDPSEETSIRNKAVDRIFAHLNTDNFKYIQAKLSEINCASIRLRINSYYLKHNIK